MIIQKENDAYVYFQIVKELQPTSVLDVGMFLKRTGSLSRQMMNCEIPREVWLDGVDFFPEVEFPIWEIIYNEIYCAEKFIGMKNLPVYELGILLGSEGLRGKVLFGELLALMKNRVSLFLADSCLKEVEGEKMQEITVEGEVYYLIDYR